MFQNGVLIAPIYIGSLQTANLRLALLYANLDLDSVALCLFIQQNLILVAKYVMG